MIKNIKNIANKIKGVFKNRIKISFLWFLDFLHHKTSKNHFFIPHGTKSLVFLSKLTLMLIVILSIWQFHFPMILQSINLYDEGVTLLGGKRFMQGEEPYLDFFTIYAPLKFAVLGNVFSIFGDSLLTSRLFFSFVSILGFSFIFIFFWIESGILFATFSTLILATMGQISMTPVLLFLIAIWFTSFLRSLKKNYNKVSELFLIKIFYIINIFTMLVGIHYFNLFLLIPSLTVFIFTLIFHTINNNKLILKTIFSIVLTLIIFTIIKINELSLWYVIFILVAYFFILFFNISEIISKSTISKMSFSRFISPLIGGILIALLFLLRIDFGGFIGLAVFLSLILLLLSKKLNFIEYIKINLKMALSFFATITPFAYEIYQKSLKDFIDQTIIFPIFGEYQELRKLPWQPIESIKESFNGFSINILELSGDIVWFFMFFVIIVYIYFWIYKAIIKDFKIENFLLNSLVLSFLIAGIIYASHRSDIGHVKFANFLAVFFLLHICTKLKHKWVITIFTPFLFLAVFYPAYGFYKKRESIINMEKTNYSFFNGNFIKTKKNDDLQEVINFFKNISPEEKVFVGVKDTSRVFINNVVLPFLLEQKVATKYHELHTGIVTKKEVQEEIIQELKDINYIVLWDFFMCEPNLGCKSTDVRILDEYIKNRYEEILKIGRYIILVKKITTVIEK